MRGKVVKGRTSMYTYADKSSLTIMPTFSSAYFDCSHTNTDIHTRNSHKRTYTDMTNTYFLLYAFLEEPIHIHR